MEKGSETIENGGETIENGAETIKNGAETIENGGLGFWRASESMSGEMNKEKKKKRFEP